MRSALAALTIATAALAAACGGGTTTTPPTTGAAVATLTAAAPGPASSATIAAKPTAAAPTATPAPRVELSATPVPPEVATTAPPAATSTSAPPPPPPPPIETGGTVTITAVNVLFEPATVSIGAGPVTIVLNNKDSAVAHNIHFYAASGASLASSDIEAGISMQTLSLGTLAPGSYDFDCDVHPTTMRGVLTVS
jgi:plastocyanin